MGDINNNIIILITKLFVDYLKATVTLLCVFVIYLYSKIKSGSSKKVHESKSPTTGTSYKPDVPKPEINVPEIKIIKPTSLINMGATCYLNSAFQGISACDTFVKEVADICHMDKNCDLKNLQTFKELIDILNGCSSSRMEISQNPIFFKWNKTGQQDSYEILVYAVNQVYNELRQHKENVGEIPRKDLAKWLQEILPMRILIQYTIECGCGMLTKSPLQSDLALHITIDRFANRCELDKLLDQFFEDDIIQDYQCDQNGCNGKDNKKFSRLCKPLPKTICVHLQRTYWNGYWMVKINNEVVFNTTLRLKSKYWSYEKRQKKNDISFKDASNEDESKQEVSENKENQNKCDILAKDDALKDFIVNNMTDDWENKKLSKEMMDDVDEDKGLEIKEVVKEKCENNVTQLAQDEFSVLGNITGKNKNFSANENVENDKKNCDLNVFEENTADNNEIKTQNILKKHMEEDFSNIKTNISFEEFNENCEKIDDISENSVQQEFTTSEFNDKQITLKKTHSPERICNENSDENICDKEIKDENEIINQRLQIKSVEEIKTDLKTENKDENSLRGELKSSNFHLEQILEISTKVIDKTNEYHFASHCEDQSAEDQVNICDKEYLEEVTNVELKEKLEEEDSLDNNFKKDSLVSDLSTDKSCNLSTIENALGNQIFGKESVDIQKENPECITINPGGDLQSSLRNKDDDYNSSDTITKTDESVNEIANKIVDEIMSTIISEKSSGIKNQNNKKIEMIYSEKDAEDIKDHDEKDVIIQDNNAIQVAEFAIEYSGESTVEELKEKHEDDDSLNKTFTRGVFVSDSPTDKNWNLSSIENTLENKSYINELVQIPKKDLECINVNSDTNLQSRLPNKGENNNPCNKKGEKYGENEESECLDEIVERIVDNIMESNEIRKQINNETEMISLDKVDEDIKDHGEKDVNIQDKNAFHIDMQNIESAFDQQTEIIENVIVDPSTEEGTSKVSFDDDSKNISDLNHSQLNEVEVSNSSKFRKKEKIIEEEDELYNLVSVIEHFGVVNGGHYVCYKKVGDKWFLTNDSRVTEVTEEEVLACQAYVLFYEQPYNNIKADI